MTTRERIEDRLYIRPHLVEFMVWAERVISLFQKLWDSLDYRAKVDKREAKLIRQLPKILL